MYYIFARTTIRDPRPPAASTCKKQHQRYVPLEPTLIRRANALLCGTHLLAGPLGSANATPSSETPLG